MRLFLDFQPTPWTYSKQNGTAAIVSLGCCRIGHLDGICSVHIHLLEGEAYRVYIPGMHHDGYAPDLVRGSHIYRRGA